MDLNQENLAVQQNMNPNEHNTNTTTMNINQDNSLNNVVHLDDDDEEADASVHLDDDDEEAGGKYHGEANDDEERVLGNELELCDVDREMENEFTKEDFVVGPISGMRFRDKDTLFAFYKKHARLRGFSVIKRNSNKKGSDTARYITYCCDRTWIHKIKFTTKSNNCKARLATVLDDSGCWRISKVIHDHNHDLLPSVSRMMAGHRSGCDSLKRDLVAHDRSGIRPSKNIRLAEVQRGGPQNLGCTLKDCRNYILTTRNFEMKEGTHSRCSTFFVKSRQSILLGCALMSHEDIDSYKLVFRTWLDAMGNVHPDAIITGQCQSIKVAIAEVIPNTIHSIWHIFSKLHVYLSGVRPSKIARAEFKSMVLDSITIKVLDRKWTEYIA
uniref:Protein FAR1-RELATED SEQUENCE 2-like n=1 Tax=Nicotiana tabacum TaxID=4097 RepID=A0A1S4DPB7_TOBAC